MGEQSSKIGCQNQAVKNFFWVLLSFLVSLTTWAGGETGKRKAEVCVPCHGVNGNSINSQYPILAGQTFRYLYFQLRDFKEGRRSDPIMSPIAQGLSKEDIQDLAEYFSAQKPLPINVKLDPAKVAAGKAKAEQILCTMCHLGGFSGQNEIPRVAGQYPEYVVKQLKAFRDRKRTNDAGNMASVVRGLSDRDIEDLAQYIASLY